MAAAGVVNALLDLSTRVPAFPGVRGAIVIDAKKGPVNLPMFMSNETQFLDYFTPQGKVDVGYSLGYFSALAYLQKSSGQDGAGIWVVRAASDPLYAGATVGQYGSTATQNATLEKGLVNPTSYDLETNDGRPPVDPSNVTVVVAEDPYFAKVEPTFYMLSETGDKCSFTAEPPSPLSQGTDYFIIKGATFGKIAFAESKEQALQGVAITLTSDFSSDVSILDNTEIVSLPSPDQNALLIYSANEGEWGNNVFIELHPYRATETTTFTNGGVSVQQKWEIGEAIRFSTTGKVPDGLSTEETYYIASAGMNPALRALAASYSDATHGILINYTDGTDYGVHTILPAVEYTKEADTFALLVFRSDNLSNPIETHICSRNPSKMDGYGQNCYVCNVLESSMYIRAVDNLMVSSSVVPKVQLTLLALGGGNDGAPVTDGAMIRAVDTLRNPEDIPMTVLMDGGWATPAYQKQGIISVCEERQDCEGILSVPYAAESSANYVNEIIDYRKLVLNANTWNAALYAPHVKIYDKFNDRSIYVSPDGYAAAQISETAAKYEMWYPVAGFRRGMLNVLDLRRRFTANRAGGGEIGLLYDAGVNPLRFYPGKGILIWGQKTLSSRPSALDRLNVALLLIVIRPAISEALQDYLFQINDPGERRLIKSMIESYMDGIQARRGVYAYIVVCDDTNNKPEDIDNYRLNVDLYIKPTKPIEYIHFTTVIARTGDSFEALTNLAG
jgi:hypothetical protein